METPIDFPAFFPSDRPQATESPGDGHGQQRCAVYHVDAA